MNKTTILAIGATFLVTILAITAFEVVEAKPPQETQETILPKTLELTPIGSSTGFLRHSGNSVLYFGTELCGIAPVTGRSMYVQFGTDALVKHGVSNCEGNSNDLDLVGDVDANFKVGDVLVLDFFPSEPQRWIEVYREQTI